MQGLLKDHLVEHQDGEGGYFTRTCTVCGAVWKSAVRPGVDRDAAAGEVIRQTHICPFCGRAVCRGCYTDVDGIALCVRCAERLTERIGKL